MTAGLALSVTPRAVTLSMLVRPVPLSEIQNGLVGLYATPHGLIRLGSVRSGGHRPVRDQVGLREGGLRDLARGE